MISKTPIFSFGLNSYQMFQLQIGSQSFQNRAEFPIQLEGYTEYERVAIQFCADWLDGIELFDQQSSGSTGIPKIIQLTRPQMEASASATARFFGIHEKIHLLCCLNPAYIAGKMMLVRALVWNTSVRVIAPSSNPLMEEDTEKLPNFIALAPIQIDAILKNPLSREKLKCIKHIIVGGAPINEGIKNLLFSEKIKAFQTYGMTETVSHVALAPIENGELTYQLLPNVKAGQDERGAIWIQSPVTCQKIIQTNDLVKFLGEGKFYWLGRADFVINSGGIKIYPEILEQKIEPILSNYFGLVSYFFFGLEDEKLGQKLILLIETSSQDSELIDRLLEDFKNLLQWYEVPKKILLITKFQRTPSGKTDRLQTIKFL